MTTNAVETALYGKLAGVSGITSLLSANDAIFNQRAEEDDPGSPVVLPYIIFQQMSEIDDNKSPHRAKQLLYLVKGVSGSGFLEAGAIDAAIDAALHGSSLTVSGWSSIVLWRESSVRFVEDIPAGGSVYHAGGVYRLRIAK